MSLPIHVGGGNRPMIELTIGPIDRAATSSSSTPETARLRNCPRDAHRLSQEADEKQTIGDLKAKGVRQLWEEDREG